MGERGMTDLDRLDALAAAPTLRLTGEQIGSITPPPDGDWFVDFDEYEEFVPKRLYDAAVRQRDELRNIILNGGLRLPGFDHWRERASSKPSDPDDVRWDCSCGYSGSPEKVQKHWAALHHKDGAS